jgi:hypothetical protein
MSNSSDSAFILRVLIGFLAVEFIPCTTKPNFCEDSDSVIDAVLRDGIRYRLAVNELMAYYDESTEILEEFIASDLKSLSKALSFLLIKFLILFQN